MSKDKFHAIILFIAHDGVTQPKWWSYWRDISKFSDRIVFKVHAPRNPKYGQQFCKKNTIGFYDKTSSWCSPNLVMIYLETGYSCVLEYPNSVIYLVSGYDVPIVPADYLFKKILNNNLSSPYNYDPTKSRFCSRYQWVAFASNDVYALYKIMITHDVFFKLSNDEYFHPNSDDSCPDEMFIKKAITQYPNLFLSYGGNQYLVDDMKKSGSHNCVTQDYRDSFQSPSPVLWTELHKKKIIRNISHLLPSSSCIKMSLIDVIFVSRLGANPDYNRFFIRKVSNSVSFDPIIKKIITPGVNIVSLFRKYKKIQETQIINEENIGYSIYDHVYRNIRVKNCPEADLTRQKAAMTSQNKYIASLQNIEEYYQQQQPNIDIIGRFTDPIVETYINTIYEQNLAQRWLNSGANIDIRDIRCAQAICGKIKNKIKSKKPFMD